MEKTQSKASLPQQEHSADFSQSLVICLESRQASVMTQSIQKKNGRAFSAPTIREIPLENNSEAFAFAKRLLASEIDLIILMTGVGIQYLVKVLSTRYQQDEIIAALKKTTLVARGPKPVQVLSSFGLKPTITIPEPNTWREIIETLDESHRAVNLDTARVAVQEYGIPNTELIEALKSRGSHVVQVPVYRWALPDDCQPIVDAIQKIVQSEADFLFVTSAVQIRHLLRVASENGLETQLRTALKQVVTVSIGPTTSDALRSEGLTIDFEPSHPKMGHMISETAKNAAQLLKDKRQPWISFVEARLSSAKTDDKSLRHNSPFLKACRLEETPYTPVWLMRQAGRYMKEYRDIRAKVPFLDLCKNKELVAEVTITAVEKIQADAAIIFSDILLIVEPLGMKLQYGAKEAPMVSFNETLKKLCVDELPEIEPMTHLSYVYDGIRLTRKLLNPRTPLIGFVGAPFTLASYIIEGGGSKTFTKTKQWMYADRGAWHALMEKITRGLIKHLGNQIEAGSDAVQIFDSWVGCLSASDYETFVLPHSKKLIDAIKGKVPVIHFGTGTGQFLDKMKAAGGDVIGVDFKTEMSAASKIIGLDRGIQGNLDPALLLSSIDEAKKQASRILDQMNGRRGHIFNLGHGVLPLTPVENVIELIRWVQESSKKS